MTTKRIARLVKMITNGRGPKYITLVGPTASGKTTLAILLAQAFNTVVVSFDSRQFYREIAIGTAKPSTDQLSKTPHYFINNLSVFDHYTAQLYAEQARQTLQQLSRDYTHIILVGGSGLYLKALISGFDPIDSIDPAVRESLNRLYTTHGIERLQALILEKDPVYYHEVDRHNPRRLIRALEVCIGTGKPYSSFRKASGTGINGRIYTFGVTHPTDELYDRINTRVDQMMGMGLESEARLWYSHRHLPALKTVGYTELYEFFDGSITRETAVDKIKQHSRNYAKRQLTWFKKDATIQWIEGGDQERMKETIIGQVHP